MLSKAESLLIVGDDFLKVGENGSGLVVDMDAVGFPVGESRTAFRTEQSVVGHYTAAFITFHDIPPVGKK